MTMREAVPQDDNVGRVLVGMTMGGAPQDDRGRCSSGLQWGRLFLRVGEDSG